MTLENKYKQILEQTEDQLDRPTLMRRSDGGEEWRLNGKLHRLDGPAVVRANGDKEWWVNGLRHRLDGPAIEWPNGHKEWYVNGKVHRLDGPASVWDGRREWDRWYIDDEEYTKEEFEAYRKLLNTSKELGVDLDI